MKTCLGLFIEIVSMSVFHVLADDVKMDAWGPITNDIQMMVCIADEKTLTTNQPLELLVSYRNLSASETFIIYNMKVVALDATYSFSVVSPSGKDVSPHASDSLNGSAENYPIVPGRKIDFEINLYHLCKFNEIGTYKITLKK